MPDLWTPPPGFFPWALTWFHPANIARFQPILHNDSECDWNLGTHKITLFAYPCDGGCIGKPVHIWKDEPPSVEDWATVSSCSNGDYICDGITIPNTSDCQVTIGTGVAAVLNDFWFGTRRGVPTRTACAIRYAKFFSVEGLAWWRRGGHAMHWLGPA